MTNCANPFFESHFCNIPPITAATSIADGREFCTQLKKLRLALVSDMSAKREPAKDKAPDDSKGNEVVQHHHHDILCGRGGGSCKNMGNYVFRNLVAANKELYLSSTRREKIAITQSIVAAIRNQNPPGRFLEKDEATGLWKDIGAKRSLKKVSQSLREGAPHLRKALNVGHPHVGHESGVPSAINDLGEGDCHKQQQPAVESARVARPPMQAAAGWTVNKRPSGFLQQFHGWRFLQNTAISCTTNRSHSQPISGGEQHEYMSDVTTSLQHLACAKRSDSSSSGSEASHRGGNIMLEGKEGTDRQTQGDDVDHHANSDELGSVDWINIFQALSAENAEQSNQQDAPRRPTLTQISNEGMMGPSFNITAQSIGEATATLKPLPFLPTSRPSGHTQGQIDRDRNEPSLPTAKRPQTSLQRATRRGKETNPERQRTAVDLPQLPPFERTPILPTGFGSPRALLPTGGSNTGTNRASATATPSPSSAANALGRGVNLHSTSSPPPPPSSAPVASVCHQHTNTPLVGTDPLGNGRFWGACGEGRGQGRGQSTEGTASSSSESDDSTPSKCLFCGQHKRRRVGAGAEPVQPAAKGNSFAQQHRGEISKITRANAREESLCAQVRRLETSWKTAEREKALLRDNVLACKDANEREIVELSKKHAAEVMKLRLELKTVTDQLEKERVERKRRPAGGAA